MIFCGIDQTGAFNSQTMKAKDLPLAIIHHPQGKVPKLFCFDEVKQKPLGISSFDSSRLLDACCHTNNGSKQTFLVGVDCVLGLPEIVHASLLKKGWFCGADIKSHLHECFRLAFEHSQCLSEQRKPFMGRQVAQTFFDDMKNAADIDGKTDDDDRAFPRRLCEQRLGAQSLFRTKPYQRNIQTGSFRFWVELGRMIRNGERFHVGPFISEKASEQSLSPGIHLLEVYPSLYWRSDWSLRKRDPLKLLNLLRQQENRIDLSDLFTNHNQLTNDHYDAIVSVLALFDRWQNQRSLFFAKKDQTNIEGFIMT